MNPDEIRTHLRTRPFEPFRLHLPDGSSYDVRHPELALVTRREVAIAIGASDGELPERMIHCAPLHITRIELLT